MMSVPFVIYHGNCYDGHSAAWVARQYFKGACECVPARYGEPPPDVRGRDVFIFDFSYPRETMIAMAARARSFRVADHHVTAQAACEGLPFCHFDLTKSGVRLAWECFYYDDDMPAWLQCVEDRDLWRFALNDTKDVHAYLASRPMTFDEWDRIDAMPLDTIRTQGAGIRQYIETWIAKAAAEAREVVFAGHRCVVVNVPYQNASEMGHHLLTAHPDCPVAIGYFQRGDGCWQYSLRSLAPTDVSVIALAHGGGGHAQAAGFESDRLVLP
jgi:hypothetical protein